MITVESSGMLCSAAIPCWQRAYSGTLSRLLQYAYYGSAASVDADYRPQSNLVNAVFSFGIRKKKSLDQL